MVRWSKERIEKEGFERFGNRFDYSKAVVTTKDAKVDIICNICGTLFQQSPNAHIHSLQGGCPTCRYKYVAQNEKVSFDEFVRRATKVHGDKYIYDENLFVDMHSNVGIVCKEHGLFYTLPHNHLKGNDCPICGNKKISESLTLSKDDFLQRSCKIHGDKYDYSLVDYKSSYEKVKIICPKHGVFEQTPHNHWKGEGCPICKKSLGEERIMRFLSQHKINHVRQFKINNDNLFCKNKNIYVDFFLPDYNTIIEYNGKQHYKSVKIWGGKEAFLHQQERDMALRQYCKEHKIRLVEIPYTEFNNIEEILKRLIINKVKTNM